MEDPFFHLKQANIQIHSMNTHQGSVPVVIAAHAERIVTLVTDAARKYSDELNRAGQQMLEIHEENKALRRQVQFLEQKIKSWATGESAPVAVDDDTEEATEEDSESEGMG